MQRFHLTLIYVLPVPLLFFSLLLGPAEQFSMQDFIWAIWAWINPPHNLTAEMYNQILIMQNIILNVRMPRVLLTFLVGAALASSGNTLQALFRNPLVDSYVLGISSGAALGAALALVTHWLPVQISAFLFGILAVCMTYGFAQQRYEKSSVVVILLSGMIISGLFIAGLSIVQYLSDPYKLQAIVQWTMGNLHQATWIKVQQACIPIILSLFIMYILRWRMNLLALGQLEAQAVGVDPRKDQFLLIFAVTLATSSSVAVAGIISLYGLFLPHIVRMMIGPDNVKTVPANICLGGSFLLLIDNISRSFSSFEIPIGIFTMLLGAPLFLYLIRRYKMNWG
ncbi:iron ABC transporter permease [Acinetobacter qingfengensis]|uniref:Iron transporter n=1 Tax=Acinetobacter qingfengensis TaxID=1262585 RepID=A0A1E7RAS5_9GAMM|nr:iron ABC transporter permease [Acinetobacter qingfengensis]KAA8734548.1 iron ABC transporter permease [Acinetobacter qingfengensis]OEY96401.1 iron transporter [Acinetobacter qingfengensis]